MKAAEAWVVPERDGAIFRWRSGEVVMEVDAALGARVTAFRRGAENLLIGPDVNALNFGSTFWPSPQSAWGWPPPVAIDSAPYAVTGGENDLRLRLHFQSTAEPILGLAVDKRVRMERARGIVVLDYAIENRGSAPRATAPWEISRVATGGLTFFPAGEEIRRSSTLAVRQAGGVVWFAYDAGRVTDHQKLFAQGAEGWLAHVDVRRRLLLVKTFPEVPVKEQAPEESQIELYADPNHTYVEVEQQGSHRTLAPGERATWSVRWRLVSLPPGIEARAEDRALLAAARALAVETAAAPLGDDG